jgi:exonuclease SbcD
MLLAHVADLHLGKIFHERDLLPDQAYMLDRLLELLALRRPAALLVAGDVYDRSIPSPEAIGLFDSFLNRAIAADPGLVVVVIPGNHDSAARLSFGAGLLERAGVHLRTKADDCDRPVLVERGGERVAIWPLPFLTPGSFEAPPRGEEAAGIFVAGGFKTEEPGAEEIGADGADAENFPEELFGRTPGVISNPSPNSSQNRRLPGLRSQNELFAEALARIERRLSPGSTNVLLAHCFAAGGEESESERVFVGTAERIDPRQFERFDYAALGHLHRHQPAGARGRYPGSPLAYSFGEAESDGVDGPERGFLLVELAPGGFETELVPLKPLRTVRRLEGPFSALSIPGAFAQFRDDYIEARLTDALPVINPIEPLRLNFPNLLSVRQAAFEIVTPAAALGPSRGGGSVSVIEDFRAFHREMKGEDPTENLSLLMAGLLEEAQREAP